MISLHIYNNSPFEITLPLGFFGYCETNATIFATKEIAYRVNKILQLLDISQSIILDEELSINNILSNEKRNTDYFTNHSSSNQHCEFPNKRRNSKIF